MNKFLVEDIVKEYVSKKARIILKLEERVVVYNESEIRLSDKEVEYLKELLGDGTK